MSLRTVVSFTMKLKALLNQNASFLTPTLKLNGLFAFYYNFWVTSFLSLHLTELKGLAYVALHEDMTPTKLYCIFVFNTVLLVRITVTMNFISPTKKLQSIKTCFFVNSRYKQFGEYKSR